MTACPPWAAPPAASATPLGSFTVRPVDPVADTDLVHAWMNDPVVARFWDLAEPRERVAAHLDEQLTGTRSRPYLGLLDGEPMSYWEVYRAALDRLAGHYPARPGDVGIHLLLGPPRFRGRGLAAHLIAAVATWQLTGAGAARVVAEPDVGNVASVQAFERAGFRRTVDIDLPEKRAALMVREPTTPTPGDPA